MTDIERFKTAFPDCEYDEDFGRIFAYNKEGTIIATLYFAKRSIEEYYEGNTLESNELNPEDRKEIKVSPEDYIQTIYGDYQSAFKAI